MTNLTYCFAVVASYLLLPSVSLCADTRPTKVFRIGVIQSLTGVAEEDGNTCLHGIRLAAQSINEKSSTKVDLLIEDDASLPKNAVSAFERLVAEHVDVIIGATWQHTMAAITPLARRHHQVLFNSSNFPEAINFSDGQGYVYTNAYAVKDDLRTFEHFLDSRHIPNVVFVRNTTNWSAIQVQLYKRLLVDRGGEVRDDIELDQIENNDWRVVLPKISALRPGAIAFFLGKGDAEVFLRRAREMNLNVPLFGASHTYDAFKSSTNLRSYEGMCFTYPLEQLRQNADFVVRYESRFQQPPQLYADSSYDALLIVYEALQRAAAKGQSLKAILDTEQFSGLFGVYQYDKDKSLSRGDTSLVCIKHGRLEIEPRTTNITK